MILKDTVTLLLLLTFQVLFIIIIYDWLSSCGYRYRCGHGWLANPCPRTKSRSRHFGPRSSALRPYSSTPWLNPRRILEPPLPPCTKYPDGRNVKLMIFMLFSDLFTTACPGVFIGSQYRKAENRGWRPPARGSGHR